MTEIVEEIAPKKRKNSKSKGTAGENGICRILTKTFPPLNFSRTDGSGARLGGKNWEKQFAKFSKEMMAQYVGDIRTTNEADCPFTFNFVIESKNYAVAPTFDKFFEMSIVEKWLMESEVDAVKIDKPGILICKWNRTPLFVAYRGNLPTDKKILLPNGVQICKIEDILDVKEFWITVK